MNDDFDFDNFDEEVKTPVVTKEEPKQEIKTEVEPKEEATEEKVDIDDFINQYKAPEKSNKPAKPIENKDDQGEDDNEGDDENDNENNEEDSEGNDEEKPKAKGKGKAKTAPKAKEPEVEEIYDGPRTIRVYGNELFIESDPTVTLEQIRQRIVDEFRFVEFSKERTTMTLDQLSGIVVPMPHFEKRG